MFERQTAANARVVPRMRLKILDKTHFTPTKLYIIFVGQRISFSCLEGVIIDKLDQRIKKFFSISLIKELRSKGKSERERRGVREG